MKDVAETKVIRLRETTVGEMVDNLTKFGRNTPVKVYEIGSKSHYSIKSVDYVGNAVTLNI
jgi:hypothetical protein